MKMSQIPPTRLLPHPPLEGPNEIVVVIGRQVTTLPPFLEGVMEVEDIVK